jgi:hypothetical protein
MVFWGRSREKVFSYLTDLLIILNQYNPWEVVISGLITRRSRVQIPAPLPSKFKGLGESLAPFKFSLKIISNLYFQPCAIIEQLLSKKSGYSNIQRIVTAELFRTVRFNQFVKLEKYDFFLYHAD